MSQFCFKMSCLQPHIMCHNINLLEISTETLEIFGWEYFTTLMIPSNWVWIQMRNHIDVYHANETNSCSFFFPSRLF